MAKDRNQPSWRAAVLASGATVEDGIRNLDTSHLQIALVLDDAGRLLGTLTDGDIRRGLLRGVGLQTNLADKPLGGQSGLVKMAKLTLRGVLFLSLFKAQLES